jgi:hypothetical protein
MKWRHMINVCHIKTYLGDATGIGSLRSSSDRWVFSACTSEGRGARFGMTDRLEAARPGVGLVISAERCKRRLHKRECDTMNQREVQQEAA